MTDYSSGKIYKLFVEGVEEFCYVGSTFHTLESRLSKHKNAALYANQTKTTACVLFQEDNEVIIELIEEYTDITKEELLARERYWIETYPECLNKNIPGREWDERHHDNRDHNLARMKNWREANKDHVRAYNQTIKPEANVKAKERYANGYGEARNAKKKEKGICEVCNKEMNKNSIWTHKKALHPSV